MAGMPTSAHDHRRRDRAAARRARGRGRAAPVLLHRPPRRAAAAAHAGVWVADGTVHDHVRPVHRGRHRARGSLAPPRTSCGPRSPSDVPTGAGADARPRAADAQARLRVALADRRPDRARARAPTASRCASRSSGTARRRSASSASVARHCTQFDQGGPRRPARRRPSLHRPGLPAGACSPRAASPRATARPMPWLLSSRGYGVWVADRRQRHALRPRRERVSSRCERPPGRCGCELLCAPTPGGAAARASAG